MDIEQRTFESFCPVALSPEPDIFEAVSARFADNFDFIRGEVLGDALWGVLDADPPLESPPGDLTALCRHVLRYVCTASFLDTLPHLDLVLTSTGFGVVSNGNVAPASSDRVERLRESLARAKDDALDGVLSLARHDADWADSGYAARWISSLFWRGAHLACLGVAVRTRSALVEREVEIAAGEAWLRGLVSPAFFDEMCAWERHGERAWLRFQAVSLARRCVAAYISRPESVGAHRRTLIGFIEGYPEEFATYFASSAYRANHFRPYENRKDDPCFFF